MDATHSTPERNQAGGGPGPGLKLAALVAIGVVASLSTSYITLLSLLAVPLVWFIAHGGSVVVLARSVRRIATIIVMLLVSFVIVPPGTASPIHVEVWRWTLNVSGLVPGGKMCLRILTIVIGSIVLRETGRPGELLTGLRQLRLPLPMAQTIAGSLALLGGPRGRRAGRGRRRGRRGAGGETDGGDGAGSSVRELVRSGKDAVAARLLATHDATVERSMQEMGESRAGQAASDAAIVTSFAVLAMSVKFVRLLPGIPFASGHKLVVILPLYYASARLTRSRFGASWMGVTLGFVAFMFGEGRFGLLEVVKYVVPGLLVDAAWPVLRRRRNVLILAGYSVLLGAGWLGATLLAGWLARAPSVFYALALATSGTQFLFSAVSGPVTYALLGAIDTAERNRPAQTGATAGELGGPRAPQEGGAGQGRGGGGGGGGRRASAADMSTQDQSRGERT